MVFLPILDGGNSTFLRREAGSRSAFAHEPIDHSLLTDAIDILGRHGNIIAGTASPEEEETIYRFIPAAAWKKETYNNLNRPFDRDIRLQPREDTATVYVRKFIRADFAQYSWKKFTTAPFTFEERNAFIALNTSTEKPLHGNGLF